MICDFTEGEVALADLVRLLDPLPEARSRTVIAASAVRPHLSGVAGVQTKTAARMPDRRLSELSNMGQSVGTFIIRRYAQEYL